MGRARRVCLPGSPVGAAPCHGTRPRSSLDARRHGAAELLVEHAAGCRAGRQGRRPERVRRVAHRCRGAEPATCRAGTLTAHTAAVVFGNSSRFQIIKMMGSSLGILERVGSQSSLPSLWTGTRKLIARAQRYDAAQERHLHEPTTHRHNGTHVTINSTTQHLHETTTHRNPQTQRMDSNKLCIQHIRIETTHSLARPSQYFSFSRKK